MFCNNVNFNHFIGHCGVFCGLQLEISGLKYILACWVHQSEARKFSYQRIRKLETIQMFALFSLWALFASLASLVLLCLSEKIADEQPNSQSSQLAKETWINKVEERAVSENSACSSSMQNGDVIMSVCGRRAKLARSFRQSPNCQFWLQILQLTSTLLNDFYFLLVLLLKVCIIFPSDILEQ